jgi:periplasmic copper chaperone A
MKLTRLLPLLLALTACSKSPTPQTEPQAADTQTPVVSTVQITDAWARASAPGQSVGAAYMTITSPQDSTLVYVETPVADSTEIHSMSMDNGVMKMRMIDELPLTANTPKKLAPGGFHLMLMDLQKPLKVGESVDVRLCFKDKDGNITDQNVTLPVKEAE